MTEEEEEEVVERLRSEIHRAIDPVARPAAEVVTHVMARVRAESGRARPGRWAAALQAGGLLIVAAVVGTVVVLHRSRPAQGLLLPLPTATAVPAAPGAEVAWMVGQASGQAPFLLGVDPTGRIVGRIDAAGSAVRSGDGALLYVVAADAVTVYSAETGRLKETIARRSSLAGDGFLSPEGRFLGILGGAEPSDVELIDLQLGRSVGVVKLPAPQSGAFDFLTVGRDASQLYAFADTWRTPSVVALGFDGSSLQVEGQARDGQAGHAIPGCDGLVTQSGGDPFRITPDGETLVTYCPSNGLVSWFDLGRLTATAHLTARQGNPFWLAPVFSPDGRFLYLQEPFTGRLQAIDLERRAIVKTVNITARAETPLQWLADRFVTPADAGGIPRTAVLSPDATRLYAVHFSRGGISVVRTADLHVTAHWNIDTGGGSVWLAGDGRTLFALNNGGDRLTIVSADGHLVTAESIPGPGYGFISLGGD